MIDFSYRLEAGPNAKQLLVLLHGYGSTHHNIASIVPEVDPEGDFVTVSPLAPISVPGGGASWYDFDDTWTADPGSFHRTLEALASFVDTVCWRFGLEASDSVVGGFSQGAGMAAWLAFDSPLKTPAGLWCFGTVVDVDDRSLDLERARDRQVLMLAGRDDPNVPLERSRAQARRFDMAGAHTTFSEHDGGHGFSRPMLDDMRTWLALIDRPT